MTKAVEQPTIKIPPTISPQRILLCSMNDASTSANGLRGGFNTGAEWTCSSESFAQAPNCGVLPAGDDASGAVGIADGVGWGFSFSPAYGRPSSCLVGGA